MLRAGSISSRRCSRLRPRPRPRNRPRFPALPRPLNNRVFPLMPGTEVEQESKTEESLDVPWNVVVHNDPVNLMSYVSLVFQRVFGFSRSRAERHMLEV